MAKKPVKSKKLIKQSRFSSRQLVFFAAIFAVVGGMVLLRSYAAKAPFGNGPLAFNTIEDLINQPVEQQSWNGDYASHPPDTWVTNPTGCEWDIDDHIYKMGVGTMAGNSTLTDTECLIEDALSTTGDYGNHRVQALLQSPTNDMKMVVSNNRGGLWTAAPVLENNMWTYRLCLNDVTPGPYPVIPGSNNGVGIRVDYTVTITSGARSTRNVTARYALPGFAAIGVSGCPSGSDNIPPSVPIGLQIVSAASGTVSLAWTASTDNSGDPPTYKIFRSPVTKQAASYVQIGTSAAGVTTYTDSGLARGTYLYYVTAVDTGGNQSAQSNIVSVTSL